MKIYTRANLQARLKAEGLPNSSPTLDKYEEQGILPEPHRITFITREDRIYSEEEIEQIIKIIKKRKHGK